MIEATQTEINFLGTSLKGYEWQGKDYIQLEPWCEAMGISFEEEAAQIAEHPVKKEALLSIDGEYHLCLDKNSFPFWLLGIDRNKAASKAVPFLDWIHEESSKAFKAAGMQEKAEDLVDDLVESGDVQIVPSGNV